MGGPVLSEGVTSHVRVGGAAYHLITIYLTIYYHLLLSITIFYTIYITYLLSMGGPVRSEGVTTYTALEGRVAIYYHFFLAKPDKSLQNRYAVELRRRFRNQALNASRVCCSLGSCQ
jgi:hypothetical protein